MLLWKQFTDTAKPPRWIRQKKKPKTVPGKVIVTVFVNGWYQAQNMVYEIAKRAEAEFGDELVFCEIDTLDRDVFMEWGILDALFLKTKNKEGQVRRILMRRYTSLSQKGFVNSVGIF